MIYVFLAFLTWRLPSLRDASKDKELAPFVGHYSFFSFAILIWVKYIELILYSGHLEDSLNLKVVFDSLPISNTCSNIVCPLGRIWTKCLHILVGSLSKDDFKYYIG